jgi:23S rRNA maturation mini-RNase III
VVVYRTGRFPVAIRKTSFRPNRCRKAAIAKKSNCSKSKIMVSELRRQNETHTNVEFSHERNSFHEASKKSHDMTKLRTHSSVKAMIGCGILEEKKRGPPAAPTWRGEQG